MFQIELYVEHLGEVSEMLRLFGFEVKKDESGFQLLTDADGMDIMLLNPDASPEGTSHWPDLKKHQRGVGVEIVILTRSIEEKRSLVSDLGYDCSDIAIAPWGSKEFTFNSRDEYLFRIKQVL